MRIDSKIKLREIDFKKLFDSYFPSLCIFAHKFVKDEDSAKDIVQEVFVRIWKSVETFESEKSMRVYFYMATKNACFDYLKKEQRRRIDGDINEEIYIYDNTVENEIVREEVYYQLETAINLLPQKAQRVIRLNLNGLSNKEIAEELDVSVNTVKTHKMLAFKKIRELYGNEYAILLLIEFYQFLN
ncbi:RNA polymerase sigma-70 factor [Marinifilum sp. RC60d5]|uniref:RNA polymerase sigma-70 factor n=1 Tax=Marinifilum sp. RC60d5 TaxID=3458414 RepID=UPI00403512AE